MTWHPRVAIACAFVAATAHAQTLFDPDLTAQLVAEGLGSTFGTLTTAIVFMDEDTLLAVNRNEGRVRRIDLQRGVVVNAGPDVLDLDVIVGGTDTQSEYGVQAMALHPDFANNGFVYIRYDQSPTAGMDTPQEDVTGPTSNVIERYLWDPAANGGNGALTLDAAIRTVSAITRYHHGGRIVFRPDGTMHTIYGDLRFQNNLLATNVRSGQVNEHATVIRLNDDGSTPADNPFDTSHPEVPAGAAAWFGYGIRNSFGMDIDPATGQLWDTENGTNSYDEINRVEAGFNSGWKEIMGPVDHPGQTGTTNNLVELPGSAYSEPEFTWFTTIGVTGMHFLLGSALGEPYDDLLLVGSYNGGHLWAFCLNPQRDGFVLNTAGLQDLVDDTVNPLGDPTGAENEEIVFGLGFGGTFAGILAIERGADGWPYVLTATGKLYRIRLACPADVNGDGTVDVLDLIDLLLCFGQPAIPGCVGEDINGDGNVNVLDLIALLLEFGATCP